MDIINRSGIRKVARDIVKREKKYGTEYDIPSVFNVLNSTYNYVKKEDEQKILPLITHEVNAEREAKNLSVNLSKVAIAKHTFDEVTNNLPIDKPEPDPA